MKGNFNFTKRTFFTFFSLGILVFFLLSYGSWAGRWAKFLVLVILGIIFLIDFLKKNFAKNFARLISLYIGFVTMRALAFVFIISYFILWPIVSDYVYRTQFDSTFWKNEQLANNWKNPIRLRMIDDLLKKYKLVGMSKNQINELLDVPRHTASSSDNYVYWLGPKRGFTIFSYEGLSIKFQNDIVIEAKRIIFSD